MPDCSAGSARTAVIAGTATTVSNRVSRRQANKWAQQDSRNRQAVPGARRSRRRRRRRPRPPRAASTSSRKLGELKEQGVLTDDGVRRGEGAHPPELTFAAGRGRRRARFEPPVRMHSVGAPISGWRTTALPHRRSAASTVASDRHPPDSPPSDRPRRHAGSSSASQRSARSSSPRRRSSRCAGNARARAAGAAQRAHDRRADRRRALRLARGDPRPVRAPARRRRLAGASSPSAPPRPRVPYSVGRMAAWVAEIALVYLTLVVPLRDGSRTRRTACSSARSGAHRAPLPPDGAPRRAVPGPDVLRHLHGRLPGQRAEPALVDPRVDHGRGPPGARGDHRPAHRADRSGASPTGYSTRRASCDGRSCRSSRARSSASSRWAPGSSCAAAA